MSFAALSTYPTDELLRLWGNIEFKLKTKQDGGGGEDEADFKLSSKIVGNVGIHTTNEGGIKLTCLMQIGCAGDVLHACTVHACQHESTVASGEVDSLWQLDMSTSPKGIVSQDQEKSLSVWVNRHTTQHGGGTVVGTHGLSRGTHNWRLVLGSGNPKSVGVTPQHSGHGKNIPERFSGWIFGSRSGVYYVYGENEQYVDGECKKQLPKDKLNLESNSVIAICLDCEAGTLTLTDLKTNQSDRIEGLKGVLFPCFYLEQDGSSLRIIS